MYIQWRRMRCKKCVILMVWVVMSYSLLKWTRMNEWSLSTTPALTQPHYGFSAFLDDSAEATDLITVVYYVDKQHIGAETEATRDLSCEVLFQGEQEYSVGTIGNILSVESKEFLRYQMPEELAKEQANFTSLALQCYVSKEVGKTVSLVRLLKENEVLITILVVKSSTPLKKQYLGLCVAPVSSQNPDFGKIRDDFLENWYNSMKDVHDHSIFSYNQALRLKQLNSQAVHFVQPGSIQDSNIVPQTATPPIQTIFHDCIYRHRNHFEYLLLLTENDVFSLPMLKPKQKSNNDGYRSLVYYMKKGEMMKTVRSGETILSVVKSSVPEPQKNDAESKQTDDTKAPAKKHMFVGYESTIHLVNPQRCPVLSLHQQLLENDKLVTQITKQIWCYSAETDFE